MERKTTWTNFLITGISALILLSSIQCKTDSESLITESTYFYINNTSQDILITIIDRVESSNRDEIVSNFFAIDPNDSISFRMKGEGAFPFYLPTDGSVSGDSAIIQNGTKCLINYVKYQGVKDGIGIFHLPNYDNYSSDIYDTDSFTLYYTFKDEDFDLALDCE